MSKSRQGWEEKEMQGLRDALIKYQTSLQEAVNEDLFRQVHPKKDSPLHSQESPREFNYEAFKQNFFTADIEKEKFNYTAHPLLLKKVAAMKKLCKAVFESEIIDKKLAGKPIDADTASFALQRLKDFIRDNKNSLHILKQRRGHGDGAAYSRFWSVMDFILQKLGIYHLSVTGADIFKKTEAVVHRAHKKQSNDWAEALLPIRDEIWSQEAAAEDAFYEYAKAKKGEQWTGKREEFYEEGRERSEHFLKELDALLKEYESEKDAFFTQKANLVEQLDDIIEPDLETCLDEDNNPVERQTVAHTRMVALKKYYDAHKASIDDLRQRHDRSKHKDPAFSSLMTAIDNLLERFAKYEQKQQKVTAAQHKKRI